MGNKKEGMSSSGESREQILERIKDEAGALYSAFIREWERLYRERAFDAWVQSAAHEFRAEGEKDFNARLNREVAQKREEWWQHVERISALLGSISGK